MNNDLISREAAIAAVERREKYLVGDKRVDVESIKNFLANRPAVDAEIVRHSAWEFEGDGYFFCKACKKYIVVVGGDGDLNYCPNCGTRMDGDVNAE